MMPRSTSAFFLAMVVLAAALMQPAPPGRSAPAQLLDLAGITEVEVRSQSLVGISFRKGEPPSFQIEDPEDTVQLDRDGDRLVVTSNSKTFRGLQLALPATITRLIVGDARVDAADPIPALEIHAAGELHWNGDITNLRLIDKRPDPEPVPADGERLPRGCAGRCGDEFLAVFTIGSGRVDQLYVNLRRSGLRIQEPDDIGKARLELGAEAWLTLQHAKRVDHIQILRTAAPAGPGKNPETKE